MNIIHAIDPETAKYFTTEELRDNFLYKGLFKPDSSNLFYTYYDRLIIGGICPSKISLSLDIDKKIIGSEFLLERREMEIINIRNKETVTVDSTDYTR